jgi:3-oxoadipate enol-lactonase
MFDGGEWPRPDSRGVNAVVTVDDVSLAYQLVGEADAPTLVLSNSLGTDRAMWAPQMESFTQRFRVLRYDMRGHGRSSVTPGDYSIERLARDVLGLADALNIDRFHFCGLSMGGMVGMWLAANAAARIDHLVLCNTAPRIGPPDVWDSRIGRVRAGGMDSIADAVLDRWFTSDYRRRAPDTIAWMRAMLVATPTDGYVASCAAVRDMDQWRSVSTIDRPTLVVSGTHDAVTPPADGREMSARIEGSRYVELDASHISNVEAAQRFTAEVMQFLDH